MAPSTTETVHRYMKASKAFRQKIQRNPSEAKAILLKAGIVVRDKSSSSGVKLAKRFQPA